MARAAAFGEKGLYAQIWKHLWERGLRELTTSKSRNRAALAVKGIERAAARNKLRKDKKAKRRRRK